MKIVILFILILLLSACQMINQIDSYPTNNSLEFPTGLYISYCKYRIFYIPDRRVKTLDMITWIDNGTGRIAGLHKADFTLKYLDSTFNFNTISEEDIKKFAKSSGYYERFLKKNKSSHHYRIISTNPRWILYFFFESSQFIGFKMILSQPDFRTNVSSDKNISFITKDSVLTFPFNAQEALKFFKQTPTKTKIKFTNRVI